MLLPLLLNLSPYVAPPPVFTVSGTWPVSLPTNVLQNGYRERQPAGSAIRTPMEVGPAKQRNRFTAINLPIVCTFEMTSAQLDIFWAFYRDTLGNGAGLFDGLPHVRTGATVMHRFDISQPPEAQADGWDSYLVTVQLEVINGV